MRSDRSGGWPLPARRPARGNAAFDTQTFLLCMRNRYQTSPVRALIDFILARAGGVPTRGPAQGHP